MVLILRGVMTSCCCCCCCATVPDILLIRLSRQLGVNLLEFLQQNHPKLGLKY